MPLLPLQILWLNMVTDTFPARALAMEPGDPDVMSRPPRDPQEAVLSPAFFASIGVYGGLITASTLAAYVWALGHSEGRASTIAFMTLALAQVFHLGNARSTEPVLRPDRALANRFALGAVALAHRAGIGRCDNACGDACGGRPGDPDTATATVRLKPDTTYDAVSLARRAPISRARISRCGNGSGRGACRGAQPHVSDCLACARAPARRARVRAAPC
jgi:Cation transporting ATPase, C-terminus